MSFRFSKSCVSEVNFILSESAWDSVTDDSQRITNIIIKSMKQNAKYCMSPSYEVITCNAWYEGNNQTQINTFTLFCAISAKKLKAGVHRISRAY